jgi:serine/threonine-protein kinase
VVAAAPDGRSLLFCRATPSTMHDIWRLPLEGERVAQPWLATPSDEANPSFSPDGRFVAYPSDDSGRHEVYVRPYPGPGPRHQVSAQGGGLPRWSRDGREIFFLSRGALWAAAVRTSVRFTAEAPRKLFELPEGYLPGYILYDATPDGQKFVMVQEDPFELRPIEAALVPNWLEGSRRMAALGEGRDLRGIAVVDGAGVGRGIHGPAGQRDILVQGGLRGRDPVGQPDAPADEVVE